LITFAELVRRDNARFAERYHEALAACLARGVFVDGPEVEAFAQRLREATGMRYATGTASGTDALYKAFAAFRPVFTTAAIPAIPFVASASAAERAGLLL
jgi:dTDP-4-amino-4,6-dideoxygalactose transaminase